jgi:[acyl-carrier-protein] S-malonyltransferase
MRGAEEGLRAELEKLEIRDPRVPVVANATAEPVTEAKRARELLIHQLTSPVRWTESIRRIADEGVRDFLELGPGKVLCGLLRRIDDGLKGIPIGDPQGIAGVEEGHA